ncbi:DivIVA domain-containing protein [Streptomyces beihaiensis]|uniref:DivIVA domain-containing protein n=1 Tax=Streptomyces beihaiensis TaxID=2984495 RepID=A0ABT3TWX4_9ACTN|nr:DivIVA domain-containing protein [Streptomyces beihaiensis]MCX3060991.1 DivIVA domain-containing protein [Streptomyces beihaiensis]
MFLFLVAALVVVVAAVTLAVLGGGDGGTLSEEPSQFYADPLPRDRAVAPADVTALRLPTAVRGYRMAEVDDALNRLGAELHWRDARITELESALTAAHTRPQPPADQGPDTSRGPDTGYGPGTGFAPPEYQPPAGEDRP